MILKRSIKNSMTLIFIMYVLFVLSIIGSSTIRDFSFLAYLRRILGLLLISFAPGYLLFRLILVKCKVTRVEDIKLILHSIGLSLFILMFSGFLLSIVYFIFNLTIKPFSELMLGVCITIVIFILYILDILYIEHEIYIIKSVDPLSKTIILSFILPFVAVISIYLINFYNNSLLSLILIVIISFASLIIIFNKVSNSTLPILLGSISLSLTILNSALGSLFRATDNMFEFCLLCHHLSKGFWDYSIYVNFNAMLGVVMTAPYYNILCNINLISIYRFVVPLISSLIPISLYKAFKEITDSRIAILSTFFFIFMYEFYTWSGLTMKMTTVELFLALILLILADKSINMQTKSILMLIYFASISVSHYGTTYIFMFCFCGLLLTLMILKYINTHILKVNSKIAEFSKITFTLGVFLVVFATSWYIYTASSSPFDTMVNIGNSLVESLLHGSILPKKSYAYKIVAGKLPEYLQILKCLYIISTVFITIGLLRVAIMLLMNKKDEKKYEFNKIYIILSAFFYISGSFVFLGGLSGAATPDRIYQIISFILAPFWAIGGSTAIYILTFKKINYQNSLKVLSIFLVIFLLFNTCFFAETVWRYNIGPMISISKSRILNNGDVYEREYLDRVSFSECNIRSAIWLLMYKCKGYIYSGQNANKNVRIAKSILTLNNYRVYNVPHVRIIFKKTKIHKKSYIYLTKFNIETNTIKMAGGIFPKLLNITEINALEKSYRIYTNGMSCVYYYP